MAVPRPVLIAILGLALCATALIAVGGVGGEEEAVAPTPIPATPPAAQNADPSKPGVRGRARTRPSAEKATPSPAKPSAGSAKTEAKARTDAKPAAKPEPRKLSPAEITKLKDDARLTSIIRAFEQDDVVVLFFSRPGAADDTGAASAVKALERVKGVQVFNPRFQDLQSYRPVIAGVGVSQVPAIVIAKPGEKAQLVEGYVDRKSLRQQVEDARR